MSQVNVNPPGGPVYRDDGGSAAAAGINLLAVVLIIAILIAIAVIAWGATAGHWFGTTTSPSNGSGNTTINVSAPARAPANPVTTNSSPASPAPAR
jgi:hypothetical protein